MSYLITLRYDGSRYHGWQRQENAVSVQLKVEQAVKALFLEEVSVCGCSRTDTGVHANSFKCSFSTVKQLPEANVISGLNFFLPKDIAVYACQTVAEDFNARFDCKSKEYVYKIYNGKYRNPFYLNKAFMYKYELDEKMLCREAADFIGYHDFSAFKAQGSDVKTTRRTVMSAGVTRDGDIVEFSVKADGFLYNMVRIMAGTLIYIAEGKISQGSIPEIIESKNRLNAGMTAPPEGLYLNKVLY